MTSIDAEKLARGWGLIAEGAMEISLAYSAIEPAGARPAVPDSVPTAPAAGAAGVPPASAAPTTPSFDELPPEGFDVSATPALAPQVDAGLGKCPVHGKRWSIKPAGISPRTKEPYDAFYRCAEKDEDGGYCKQKPQKIWRDTHPIPGAAAA